MNDGASEVFINCPFDDDYRPFFNAVVFTIISSGFVPRCALEVDDGAENRLDKILKIIGECRYGVHDISRTEVGGAPPLPRFNMPLELGLFLGAKRYGDPAQRLKRGLIFDREQYRYQRFMSDISGHDIHSHDGNVDTLVVHLARWLRDQSGRRIVPGGRVLAQRQIAFSEVALPAILAAWQVHAEEMSFGDLVAATTEYVGTL